jgi:bifunctional non-homologous end joining protein LigD
MALAAESTSLGGTSSVGEPAPVARLFVDVSSATKKRGSQAVRQVPGNRARLPQFIEPCFAKLVSATPHGAPWIHEIKYDGYRVQAHLNDNRATVFTRRGHDWTNRFGPIAHALKTLTAKSAVLDGEVVVRDARGVPDFAALHADLAAGRTNRLVCFLFDLLFLDGEDLRALPLIERKRRLRELLPTDAPPLLYSDHFEEGGKALFRRACEMGLEGIVSKKRDAPYRSGRSEAWVKTKCKHRDSFPIVAFVEKLGANPRRIASLYLGRREGDRLLYAGKAQSGFTDESLYELRERLDPFITNKSPLTVPVKKPKATWVRPVVEAEVEYSARTADGLLRAPVYRGIREDLRDQPERRTRRSTASSGVAKENVLQLLPDAVAPTADELKAYWRKVGRRALKYLGKRPLKLVRHVSGTTFYHKGPLPPVPDSVHQLRIEKREGGEGVRLWVDDIDGLLGLVDIGAVELHPWNATVDDLEHPDLLVFDLDPGDDVEWPFVMQTALALREMLKREGLDSWPKVTGGKGVHVMVPVEPDMSHDDARAYCRAMAERLVEQEPARYTVSSAPGRRSGRVFIDYLRNGRGTTAVGTFSPRARLGFPIAAPTPWRAIERGVRPDAFRMDRLPTAKG